MEMYWLRKKHKLCVRCGKKDAYTIAGRTRCYECSEKGKNDAKKYNEKHAKEIAEKGRTLYEERKAVGMCPVCGKRKPENGNTLCGACSAYKRKWWKNNRDSGIQPRLYGVICWRCNKAPVAAGSAYCAACRERAAEQMRQNRQAGNDGDHPWKKP